MHLQSIWLKKAENMGVDIERISPGDGKLKQMKTQKNYSIICSDWAEKMSVFFFCADQSSLLFFVLYAHLLCIYARMRRKKWFFFLCVVVVRKREVEIFIDRDYARNFF